MSQQISIPEQELSETFIRASGPGGQNVNKVSSAVQLRFDVRNSPSLAEDVKARLIKLAGSCMTKEGELVIEARRFRDRERNREDARARLSVLIARAAVPPAKRRKTKVPKAQKQKRLADKRKRGEVKTGRSRPSSHDD